MRLPPGSSYFPLKGTDYLISYPPSVKIPFLGPYSFAIHIAGLHFAGVECDMVGERFVRMGGFAIEPGGVGRTFISNLNSIVGSSPFPFAKCAARCRCKVAIKLHIFRWNVVNRRVAGFQYAFGAMGVCDDQTVEDH